MSEIGFLRFAFLSSFLAFALLRNEKA